MIGIKPDISASTVPSSAAIRILLVEDNVDNQFLFCAFVKKLSCQIEVAENGAIGVEKFKSGSYDLGSGGHTDISQLSDAELAVRT